MGNTSFFSNSTGSNNICIGTSAMSNGSANANTVAVGFYALNGSASITNSTAVGYQAGVAATGAGNQFFGYNSGSAVTSGAKNVILGSHTGNSSSVDIRTLSNSLVLSDGDGNVRYYNLNGASSAFVGESGNFVQSLYSKGTGSQVYVDFRVGWTSSTAQGTQTGSITTNGTGTTYATSSDYRLKNTITPMTGALAKVALLKPCTYKWNSDGSNGEGFIAHELAEVVPDAVVGNKDGVDANGNPNYQGIDTSFLVATLTAAIQELNVKFEAYKASHP
jgi:hypothetical protein